MRFQGRFTNIIFDLNIPMRKETTSIYRRILIYSVPAAAGKVYGSPLWGVGFGIVALSDTNRGLDSFAARELSDRAGCWLHSFL
jgi:hypothetical protein